MCYMHLSYYLSHIQPHKMCLIFIVSRFAVYNHFFLIFLGSMDSIVLQICYDSWWKTLVNSRMKYANAENKAFFVQKNCTFDQLLARLYKFLQINLNKCSIMIKSSLRFSNTTYHTCSHASLYSLPYLLASQTMILYHLQRLKFHLE